MSSALSPLRDAHGRVVRKLRISLTDRCNFRCGYCMPEKPQWADPHSLLQLPDHLRMVRLLARRGGLSSLRLTGGEPLLVPWVPELIQALREAPETADLRIGMTSNGLLLQSRAEALLQAGLNDVNVSIDTLDPERFDALTRTQGRLAGVLQGIRSARAAGLPVKLNCVLVRGRNEADLLPLLEWALAEDLTLRFIEFMPLEGGAWWRKEAVITEAEILRQVGAHFGLPQKVEGEEGPATLYSLPGGGRFGVIPTVSRPFCGQCDRLRLTASGHLYNCLFAAEGQSLKPLLDAGAGDDDLWQALTQSVRSKGPGYAVSGVVERPITMHALGG